MANKYWWGGGGASPGNGTIQTAANWSSSSSSYVVTTIPTSADDVFFTGSGYTVSGTALTCAAFTVSGTSITFTNTGAITTNGNISVVSGTTLTGTGSFIVNFGTIDFGGNTLTGTNLTISGTTDTCTGSAAADTFTPTTAANTPINGTPVQFTGTTAPAPLSFNTIYYVVSATSTNFKVALTPGGAAINITFGGTGLRFYSTCIVTNNSIIGSVNDTFTLTTGAIDLNGLNITYGRIYNTDGSYRIINFNNGSLIVTGAGSSTASTYTQSVATYFTLTGTPNIYFTNTTNAATVYVNGGTTANFTTESNSVNFIFNTNQTFAINFVGSCIRNFTLSGTSGAITVPNTAITIFGSINCPAGSNAVFTSGTTAVTFAGSGSMNLTLNGKAFQRRLTMNGAGGTLTPDGNLTLGQTFDLLGGTFDFNGYNLSCDSFNNSSTTARTLAFGSSGTMTITGTGTCYNASAAQDLTNFSYTGTSSITITNASSTPAIYLGSGTEAQAMNIAISGGGSTALLVSGAAKNLDFTGYPSNTSGTTSGTLGATVDITIYGALTIPSVGSNGNPFNVATGTTAFIFASATANTSQFNGKTIDRVITKQGAGTLTLLDAVTMGSTATSVFNLTGGTVNLNNNTITTLGFNSTGSTTRSINFNGGKIIVSGSTATAWTASGTNFTMNTTGTISMTGTSGKTFAAGNFSYPTVSQDGAGVLTFTGASLYNRVTNSVTPSAILYTPQAPNCTISVASPAVFTPSGGSSPPTGVTVVFTTTGTLPTGITTGTVYYVSKASASTFNIATSMANAIAGTNLVATTGAGSGTHTSTFGNAVYDFAINGAAGLAFTTNGSCTGTTLTVSSGVGIQPGMFVTGTFGAVRIVSGSGTTWTVTPSATFSTTVVNGSNDFTLASTTNGTKHYLSDPTGVISTVQYVGIKDSQALGGAIWYASNESNDYGNNTGWNFVQSTANTFFFMPR